MASDVAQFDSKWNYPTAIRFGVGKIKELPDACRELGIKKPLLVTDSGLAGSQIVADAVSVNEGAGLSTVVFGDVRGNPVGANVDAGVATLREGHHDGVIAFGGGSALDAAKAIALMAGQKRPLWDFEDVGDWYTRVDESAMVPVVAVPTTSGTGSEVGRSSVLVDQDAGKKKIIFHAKMVPSRVICDPALTVGMPPKLTGAVGMDALSHNLEAFLAPGFHPMADGIALEGMRLVQRSLERACDNGDDLVARSEMMAASLMGATAFQKGLGAMHSVAHALGGKLDVHHGTAVAVMMPYVIRLNAGVVSAKLDRLASFLDLSGNGETAVLDWVQALRKHVGIPNTLVDLGVAPEDVAVLVPLAVKDPTAGSNPVELTEARVTKLIEDALAGRLD